MTLERKPSKMKFHANIYDEKIEKKRVQKAGAQIRLVNKRNGQTQKLRGQRIATDVPLAAACFAKSSTRTKPHRPRIARCPC